MKLEETMTTTHRLARPCSLVKSSLVRKRLASLLLLAGVVASLSGCKSGCCYKEDPGRCGLPDLCDPPVAVDPFQNDQCVPAKGVDPAHFGYNRPQWSVLATNHSACCNVAPNCPQVEIIESPVAVEIPPAASQAAAAPLGPVELPALPAVPQSQHEPDASLKYFREASFSKSLPEVPNLPARKLFDAKLPTTKLPSVL